MEFVDYHVGAPVIAENADSKNKFIRKLEKGLETFQYQAPLSINCHSFGISSLSLKSICRFWELPMR